MRISIRLTGWWALAVVSATGLSTCAKNPVTGKNELALVSESQEIAMGQEYAQQIVKTMGVYREQKVQDYVSGLGTALAARSERPQLPWAFYVMDDPTVNAFALPGGSIFITRGIMTHMNNEAELVGVLGHEIGHVTARHSVQQMSRQQLAQIGLGVGSILSSTVAQYAGLASQGLGVLFLKYGRDAETQADELGFRYMVRDQYDPRAMATMFETLQRVSDLEGAGRIPEWASTHPDPGNRVQATMERIDTLSVPLSQLRKSRETYLPIIAGMTYGDDPRQGFIEGNTFYHPELRFKLDLPAGWQAQNTPAGSRRGEPPAGRHAPADRAGQGLAGGGGQTVLRPGGCEERQDVERADQRLAGCLRLLRGADGTGRACRALLPSSSMGTSPTSCSATRRPASSRPMTRRSVGPSAASPS